MIFTWKTILQAIEAKEEILRQVCRGLSAADAPTNLALQVTLRSQKDGLEIGIGKLLRQSGLCF